METVESRTRRPLRELSNVIPPSSTNLLSSAPRFPVKNLNHKFDSNSKISANNKNKKRTRKKDKGKENCKSAKEGPSSVPSPQPKTPFVPGLGDSVGHEPSTVYRRRHTTEKRKSKGKEIADPLSSSVEMRIADLRARWKKDADDENGLSKSCPLPHKRKQRKETAEGNAFKQELPQDFIDKQRAYFAEVDAFVLEEEEASADELET